MFNIALTFSAVRSPPTSSCSNSAKVNPVSIAVILPVIKPVIAPGIAPTPNAVNPTPAPAAAAVPPAAATCSEVKKELT